MLRQEYGEVLFCDYGLSGPPILQVSGAAATAQSPVISLDLMPEKTLEALKTELKERISLLSFRTADEFFTGMMNKRLGQVLIKSAGYKLNMSVSAFDNNAAQKIATLIKNLNFTVTGNTGFINSQVTSGGLDTRQFDPKTMMSLECKGFYAIGEILDIDGDCGGFNLQWAWSSALCAADAITKKR